MQEIEKLFDDLRAFRRTAEALPETASSETRSEVDRLIMSVETKLIMELLPIPEDELQEVFERLDAIYRGEAQRELEALRIRD